MATLDVSLSEIRNELTRFFQEGRSYGASSDTGKDVDAAIKRGLRQFYTPPVLPGERNSHTWSFLYPESTIVVFGNLTGTCTTSPWNTTALVDTGAEDVDNVGFQNGVDNDGADLVGQLISILDVSAGTTFKDDGATPPIATNVKTVTDKNNIVSEKTFSNTPASSTTDTYVITVDGNYILPKNFGGLVGPGLSFDAVTGYAPITITSESRILALRQDSRQTQTFRPQLVAVRPTTVSGGTGAPGQRWELMLWPIPDAVYTLHFRFLIAVDDITSPSNVPPGGMFHHETILASCLAVAESMLDPAPRVKRREEHFFQRLAASISLDRRLMAPDSLGVAGDSLGDSDFSRIDLLQKVSYNATFYD